MAEIKIDKNIPMANTVSRNNYPFSKMEVGDSFAVNVEDFNKVRPAASWYGKRNNMKFSVRHWEGAYRCWRVK